MDDMLRVMSAQVVVHPSRHEFFVDGTDTILDAALRAGLALNYGCSSGNCGLCKARVVSGQVRRIRHHDYVLSEAEKLQGYTLLCSHTAVSDLVIEALEAREPGDIPQQQIGARVKAVGRLADDVMLLHLQTPRNNRLRFLAGQSATLSVLGAEPMELPVASCPCDDRNLQFHIERNSDHSFAERVFHSLSQGDPVTVWGPWGDFVLRPDSTRSTLFLVCDTGFARLKSLIEHAIARDVAEHIDLYWVATHPGGHYLANLCRSWADALEKFRFHPMTVGASAGSACAGAAADLVARLEQEQPQLPELDVYVAGPQDFVAAIETLLVGQGLPRGQISTTLA
jgi:CDP-4-dehydro-6-deoxyglucose reductase